MRNREHMFGDQRCANSAINVRRQVRHYLFEVERQVNDTICVCGHLANSVALRCHEDDVDGFPPPDFSNFKALEYWKLLRWRRLRRLLPLLPSSATVS